MMYKLEFEKIIDRIIENIFIAEGENSIVIDFNNQTSAVIYLEQLCCEHLYITTSDDLNEFSDSKILSFKEKNVSCNNDECGVIEIGFFEIQTSKGIITFETHNEHNGYYGGIVLDITLYDKKIGEQITNNKLMIKL